MRYKRMGNGRQYRLNVPQLSGGVNVSTEATLIADNELVEAKNVQWRGGALRTRKALCAKTDEPLFSMPYASATKQRFQHVCTHPFTVDGELCTVMITAANGIVGTENANAACEIVLVTMDGEVKSHYSFDPIVAQAKVVVPCDKEKYGVPFLIFRGAEVFRPNDENGVLERIPDEELYAPLVMVNGTSTVEQLDNANGVMFEGYNTLCPFYRAQYTSSVTSSVEYYKLPRTPRVGSTLTVEIVTEHGIASGTVVVNGEAVSFDLDGSGKGAYQMHANASGVLVIKPSLPPSTISGNVTVTAECEKEYSDLGDATLGMWFGGTNDRLGGTRLFLSGFGNAKVVWSDLGNPLYFPENNYMYVGDLSQAVTMLEKQEDMLVIFKERELYYTTYVQGSIDAANVAAGTNVDVTTVAAYFPLTQLSPYVGCDCPHTVAVCRNRLVWLCRDGRVYTLVTAGQYSERNVREIGQKIAPLLGRHTVGELSAATAADHDGRYLLLIGNTAYTFDYSSSGFVNLTSYNSAASAAEKLAWFVYEFAGLPIRNHRLVSDGASRLLLFVTQDVLGVYACVCTLYTLTDGEEDVYNIYTVDTDGALGCNRRTTPIAVSFTTKAYDCGDTTRFKRVKALFLTAQCDAATVRFIPDGTASTARKTFRDEVLRTHLIVPGVQRCQTLSVCVEAESKLAVRGLSIQYAPFGTVR